MKLLSMRHTFSNQLFLALEQLAERNGKLSQLCIHRPIVQCIVMISLALSTDLYTLFRSCVVTTWDVWLPTNVCNPGTLSIFFSMFLFVNGCNQLLSVISFFIYCRPYQLIRCLLF